MAWFAKIEILTINFRQTFFSVNQCFLNSLIMLKIYKNDIIIVSSNFSQSFAWFQRLLLNWIWTKMQISINYEISTVTDRVKYFSFSISSFLMQWIYKIQAPKALFAKYSVHAMQISSQYKTNPGSWT